MQSKWNEVKTLVPQRDQTLQVRARSNFSDNVSEISNSSIRILYEIDSADKVQEISVCLIEYQNMRLQIITYKRYLSV